LIYINLSLILALTFRDDQTSTIFQGENVKKYKTKVAKKPFGSFHFGEIGIYLMD